MNQLEQGDDAAADSLLELVYDELRRLAKHFQKIGFMMNTDKSSVVTVKPYFLVVLSALLFAGCSGDDPQTTSTDATTGFDSPEDAFAALNQLGDEPDAILQVIPPKEGPMVAFQNFAMAKFFMSMFSMAQPEEVANAEIAKDFKAIIRKHELGERLNFSPTEDLDEIYAIANLAFGDVDLSEFLKDMNEFHEKHLNKGPTESPNAEWMDDPEPEAQADTTPGELRDLAIEGNEATGTVVRAGGESEPIVFLKVDGRWYFSFWESQLAAESTAESEGFDAGGASTEFSLMITFDTPQDFQSADRKMLMKSVKFEGHEEVKIKKDDETKRVLLTFWSEIGEIDRSIETMKKISGVKDVEMSLPGLGGSLRLIEHAE